MILLSSYHSIYKQEFV